MTVPGAAPTFPTGRADVELRLPADGAFVSVLRTTAAGLAARLDFTIDDIEDLSDEIINRSEEATRNAIRKLKPGTYHGEAVFDVPGGPSSRIWPEESMAISISSTASPCPTTARPTASRMRPPSC